MESDARWGGPFVNRSARGCMDVSALSVNNSILTSRSWGWFASLTAHLIVVAAIAFLMTDLRHALQPEPFRWDISMVEPPVPQIANKSSNPHPTPIPPKISEPLKPPIRAASSPHQQQITKTQQINQVIQSKPQVMQQEVRATEPVKQIETVAANATYSQPVYEQEVQFKSVERPVVTPESLAQSDTPPLIDHSSNVVSKALAVESEQGIKTADSSPIERVSLSDHSVETIHTPVGESSPVPTEVPVTQKVSAIEQSPVSSAVVEPTLQASIQSTPAQVKHATKPDYGWLIEALWSRVERFKRYPYIARTNRWEGMVVLQAVISQDGKLLDLKVAESSGHQLLDQDAMDVMRKSCPLHLEHPLGRSQVVVNIPISYKLN